MKNYSCVIIDLTEAIKRDPGGADGTASRFLHLRYIFLISPLKEVKYKLFREISIK